MRSPPSHSTPLLRQFSTETVAKSAPAPSNGLGQEPRRPSKLVRSPPLSGRPSVTFSLALEEQMGGDEVEQPGNAGSKASMDRLEEWAKCCSPTSPLGQLGLAQGGEPRVKLLLFCASVPLMECARFIGWLATIPIVISIFLLPLAPSSLVELLPELVLLGAQSVCVLALFFGLQHQLPEYLKPFLFFGLFWNLLLLLLLLFSLIELLVSRERFCAQIWLTVYELVHGQALLTSQPFPLLAERQQMNPVATNFVAQLYREDQQQAGQSSAPSSLPPESFALGLSLCLVLVLALTILVDGWLLNIVLLAYLHLKKRAKRRQGPFGTEDWEGPDGANGRGEAGESRQALLTSPKKQQNELCASRTSSCASVNSTGAAGNSDYDKKGLENGGFQHSSCCSSSISSPQQKHISIYSQGMASGEIPPEMGVKQTIVCTKNAIKSQ